MEINFDNPIPLHIQISNLLQKEIKHGRYRDKIPSERDLMDRFAVSRTTVREAVSSLVNAGILTKIHGKGTFVSKEPPVHEWLSSLNSFTETVRSMGMKPGSKLLHSGMTSAPEKIAEILHVDVFYTIERLRFADDIPVAIERHYYPQEIGLELAKSDLNTVVLYDLLENSLGKKLWEAEQFITSEIVAKNDSKNLDVPRGSSVLSVKRIITDENEHPIEFYKGIYRPDMYVFRIKTKRKPSR